ncbi:hypothetical protein [Synechococcus elongatus]|uniref:hypothetical protein n=1 Tax=Synechococcus elongatus TaxID=32046 RepID=UPI0030D03561
MTAILLPYRSCDLDGGFTVSLTDDSQLETERSLLARSLAIAAEPEVESLTLEFNLTPPGDWRLCVPEPERKQPPVIVAVRLISRREQYRQLIRLEKSGLTWTGYATLPIPSMNQGDYEAEAMFIRDRAGESNQGYAWLKGQIIARSRPWRISISPQTAPSGNFADVRWVDFKNSEGRFPLTALYAVEISDRPIILLNRSCRTSLYRLLMNQGRRRHLIPAARDTLFSAIAGGVWSVLLSRTLVELNLLSRDLDQSEQDVDLISALPDWIRLVLNEFAPLLYPECSEDVLSRRLVEDATNPVILPRVLTERIPTAVQSRAGLMRAASLLSDCLSNSLAAEDTE